MPTLPPAYRAIILDQQDQLQRLVKSAGVAPVRALYDRMLEDVTRRLGATPAGTFTHQQLSGLLAQIKLGLARVQRPLSDAVEESASKVGIHAARTLLEDTAKLEHHFSGAVISLPLLETARLRGLVDGQVSSLMRVHATSMARFGTQLVGRMEEELGVSLSTGESHAQAIDRVMNVGELQWYRAERIVRTEMSFAAGRSARMAADEQAEELDGDLWSRWTEHVSDEGMPLDDRVGVDSEAMHGQVAPPGQPFTQPPTTRQGEPVGDSLVGQEWTSPPNRPNDRAVLVPWRASWGVPGWRWDGDRRVPVTEAAAQRQNESWMRSRGRTAEISSDDEGSPLPPAAGYSSPTVEPEDAEPETDAEPAPRAPPPIGFASPTLAPDEIPEHGDLTEPRRTEAADPQAIADHGWYEPAGYEADLERAERAYEEVADGLEQPVQIGVTPRHNLVIGDADDAARVNAAADLDAPIPVHWHRIDSVPAGHVAKAGADGPDPGLGIGFGRIAGSEEDAAIAPTAAIPLGRQLTEVEAEEHEWKLRARMAKEQIARDEAEVARRAAELPKQAPSTTWQPGDELRTRQVVFESRGGPKTADEWYQHDLRKQRERADRWARDDARYKAEKYKAESERLQAEREGRARAEDAAEPPPASTRRPGLFARAGGKLRRLFGGR